jgi:hypothetical protein
MKGGSDSGFEYKIGRPVSAHPDCGFFAPLFIYPETCSASRPIGCGKERLRPAQNSGPARKMGRYRIGVCLVFKFMEGFLLK